MLGRLLGKRNQAWTPRGPEGRRAYAIGDIHGRADLLEELLERIEADNEARDPAKTWLVFLGDLIDRGPDSRGVIERLVARPPAFARNVFIMGNHEESFLTVLSGDESILQHWLVHGGSECAESYGVTPGWMLNATPAQVIERLKEEVPASHATFLENMADSFRFGDYLFVHAGIRPGVDLRRQAAKDLRWIREGFLDDLTHHGLMVVHGHTIVERPEQHPNRIAIDTGAYRYGTLTALGLEGAERWFVEAREVGAEPRRALA